MDYLKRRNAWFVRIKHHALFTKFPRQCKIWRTVSLEVQHCRCNRKSYIPRQSSSRAIPLLKYTVMMCQIDKFLNHGDIMKNLPIEFLANKMAYVCSSIISQNAVLSLHFAVKPMHALWSNFHRYSMLWLIIALHKV